MYPFLCVKIELTTSILFRALFCTSSSKLPWLFVRDLNSAIPSELTRDPVILIRGESHRLRESVRVWRMGHGVIPEVDEFRHLGITISVSGSVLPHTVCSMSSARSAFYARF